MSILETCPILPDDQQLIIKGCLAGDRASQQKLYNLYARKMMGVCLWYGKNREEAEEILQDGFMRVFTYLDKFTGKGSFEGWIRKIMVSAALIKYRNKSRLRPVVEYSEDLYDAGESAAVIALIDAKELVKLVQTLSPGYRLVFNLYVLEGMKHREIAEILGISENTSKSNLADARNILQKALGHKKKLAAL